MRSCDVLPVIIPVFILGKVNFKDVRVTQIQVDHLDSGTLSVVCKLTRLASYC